MTDAPEIPMPDEVPYFTAVGIGAGPANLSLAALFPAAAPADVALFDRQPGPNWHPRLLHPGVTMQTSWMKDLVSLVDPTHPLTFMNYLVSTGRLYNLLNAQFSTIPRREYVRYLEWAAARIDRVHWGVTVDRVSWVEGAGFTLYSGDGGDGAQPAPRARGRHRAVPAAGPGPPARGPGLRAGRPGRPAAGDGRAGRAGGGRRRRADRGRVRAGAAGPGLHRHPLARPPAVVPADGRLAAGQRVLPAGVPALPAGAGAQRPAAGHRGPDADRGRDLAGHDRRRSTRPTTAASWTAAGSR